MTRVLGLSLSETNKQEDLLEVGYQPIAGARFDELGTIKLSPVP